ncbi:MATE family efflux transporter [Limnochorda pilosa]|uniref:Probable multidrug resistance protein NorM n=1 Tax=Limnochorda pilosa TaxID=1555112 RepID=A0A0K2SI13_LIMPI|nr:MATE family efflux transporter [Limnochorda pilosa]BAS26743.1 multidrug transporter MatE [Limnochorda pilosa]
MRDFTTGSIWQHILAFSWPMFVGNLFQALYNTVDSFWVGRFLGAEALGAVSIAFPVIFALVALIMGLTMATTTLVAQYRGARDEDQVRRTVANSLMLTVALGLISTVVGFTYRVPILRLMRTPSELLEPASLYLGLFLLGLIPMFLYNVLSSILRGLGDSRTPLRFLVYATVLNILLDPLLILGWGPIPAMGIGGVAWATVIAQTLAAGLAVRYIARHTNLIPTQRDEWRLDGSLAGKLFTIGVPAALQSSIVSFSMVVVASLVNTFGPGVVAAFGAAGRLDQFAFLPAMSISLAVTALVGQNLGAGRQERVREIVGWASILTVCITGLMTLIAVLEPVSLIQVFTQDAAVLDEGARYLRIVGLNYVPLALMFILTGVLRGAGDTFASMIISFVTLWVVRLPLAWFLSYMLGWGVSGTWWSILISTSLGLLLNWLYYRTGNWRRKVVAGSQASPA